MIKQHDLITTYKHTLEFNSDVILVVGREPNEASQFITRTGKYDFDSAPKCAFWNQSYGSIGRIAGLNSQSLKQICRATNASPIAFTDGSPIPIKNHVSNKNLLREKISTQQIEQHVENIFSLDSVINKTTLVILSGHESGSLSKKAHALFKHSSHEIQRNCEERGITCISIPFLYGNNQPEILETLAANDQVTNRITEVLGQYQRAA